MLGSGIVTEHLQRHRVNQVSGYTGSRLKIGGQLGAARANVDGEVVAGNERIGVIPDRSTHIGIVGALIRIP